MANGAIKLQNSTGADLYPITSIDNIIVSSGTTTSAKRTSIRAKSSASDVYFPTERAVSLVSSSLAASIATKQSTLSAGFGIALNGATVSLARTRPITTVPAASSTVTLEPGEAYVIDATTTSKTLNLGTVPSGNFGLESHIELFVANAGYIHVGSNVTLVDQLEPDAVNNCTVRFHDGHAIISVEDHVEAYMVNDTGTGSATSGTLAYGLKQTAVASSYIGFRSELNTSSVPTGGATATVAKHIVGNGMDVGPTITGNLIVSSGATLRDVKLSGVTVMSGTASLTNVYIPSGATVAANTGATIKPEKVVVDGTLFGNVSLTRYASSYISGSGTVDFGGSAYINNDYDTYGTFTGVTFSGGSGASYKGAFYLPTRNRFVFSGCSFENNAGYFGCICADNMTSLNVTGCTFSGTSVSYRGGDIAIGVGSNYNISNCTFETVFTNAEKANISFRNNGTVSIAGCIFKSENRNISFHTSATTATVILSGSNTFSGAIAQVSTASGSLDITPGAILDLTGNTNATTINPGGSITFESGGATVLYSSGTVHGSYSMDNVVLPAGAKLTNTAVVALDGTTIVVSSGTTASASGCVFSGGSATTGGGLTTYIASYLSGVTFLNCSATSWGGGAALRADGTLEDCIFSGCTAPQGGGVMINAGNVTLKNCVFRDCYAVQFGRAFATSDGGSAKTVILDGGDFGDVQTVYYAFHNSNSKLILKGAIKTIASIKKLSNNYTGTLNIESGTVLDLTNNTSAWPIDANGDRIIVANGGCQVITSAGATVSITGGTYTKINNDGTTA